MAEGGNTTVVSDQNKLKDMHRQTIIDIYTKYMRNDWEFYTIIGHFITWLHDNCNQNEQVSGVLFQLAELFHACNHDNYYLSLYTFKSFFEIHANDITNELSKHNICIVMKREKLTVTECRKRKTIEGDILGNGNGLPSKVPTNSTNTGNDNVTPVGTTELESGTTNLESTDKGATKLESAVTGVAIAEQGNAEACEGNSVEDNNMDTNGTVPLAGTVRCKANS